MNKKHLFALLLSASCFTAIAALAQTTPAPSRPRSHPARHRRRLGSLAQPRPLRRRPRPDLLPRLTLPEKIALLHADGTFTSAGVPRLGIPKLWMSDGPNGVREEIQPSGWNSANHTDDFATAMPASIGLAATFDPELAKAYGNVIGQEARTRNKNIMLCPGLNIMRTPLNGRNSEYFGEDPFLASRMAVGFINGVQQNGVAACAKHYALNNQETNRGSVNVTVDERTMREIYLPAFKAAVKEAHVWAVMAAYNRVNGQYCSENDFLLTQVLKKDWGFQGLVMTDWGGMHSTVAAARSGLDLEMGTNVTGNHNNDYLGTVKLEPAIGDGDNQVPMSRIDDMALRNLRVMAATGLLDVGIDRDQKTILLLAQPHLDAARNIVESACVLLKNKDSLLPLDQSKLKSIAVIGDVAQTAFAYNGDSARIKTRNEVTVLQGIKNHVGDKVTINFARGYTPPAGRGGTGRRGGVTAPATATAPDLTSEATAAAKNADVAIVVAGLYRAQDQEGTDRPSFNLPAGESELIQAVCLANPKTIVILTGGSPSSVNPWLDQCGALMMYWYGGTEGGNGLAALLFGDTSPTGHLPCTWPRQIADSPAHSGDASLYPGTGAAARGGPLAAATGPQVNYAEGILVGYRWFDAKNIEPQFPFGFGLTYTTFAYSNLKFIEFQGGDLQTSASITVTNTGPREAATVVQVYVGQDSPTVQRPPRELKGLQKVSLKPGETKTVLISLNADAYTHYDVEKHAWVADPGTYTIYAGDSSRNLPLKTSFKFAGSVTIKEGT